jgi:hypothetical protein
MLLLRSFNQFYKLELIKKKNNNNNNKLRGCRGHGRVVVGITTTCAISGYHH